MSPVHQGTPVDLALAPGHVAVMELRTARSTRAGSTPATPSTWGAEPAVTTTGTRLCGTATAQA
ncbi:hypothetical protein [Streptomyces mirabilis]|uniref:hypothetical protein n=1 Tax=Streptomyces mirabilis TaxID=68239 RepID=UPI0036C055EE